MESESGIIFKEMLEVVEEFKKDSENWLGKGNKTAAIRARKATASLATLGKAFRKASIAEARNR